jgi:FtsP/CotA-like multicopper oxidase with cupredoxin domain
MLSRRHVLIGCGCAFAATVRHIHAETSPGVTVLHATSMGFGGAVPGPAIRARRGDEIKVRLVNGLDEPMALHWYGVRVPNPMDGGVPLTGAPVAPGASIDYRLPVPDAGTFWYRAASRSQQESGLYGALIVAEPVPPLVDQDQLLIFGGRRSSRDGAQEFTVNGVTALDIAARANERLRLRFVNASARPINAQIDNHRVIVMALDGEPAEPFASRDGRIVLAPGNRADVFVDATLAPGSVAPITLTQDRGEPAVLRLVYGEMTARRTPLGDPAPLAANPLPIRMDFSRALRVALAIEGGDATALAGKPLFSAERGRTVVMAIDNRAAQAHVVHLHGHHFRLLDRLDDGWKPYWLDTVAVDRRQTARIAFRADNPGRWLIEQQAIDGPAAGVNWFDVK